MSQEKKEYKSILKANSIFGGVQVFKILIKVIQSKTIAILLGPSGMGVLTLFNESIRIISVLTNFGLGVSAVKNIAEASKNNEEKNVIKTVSVLRTLVWVTGLLGLLIVVVLSPYLSQWAFNTDKYTWAFIWLSITLLFNQLSSGQLVLLQGLRKYKYLANAQITGSVIGLIVSLPLYYFYGVDGIVPAIILISLANLIRSWYFAQKVTIQKLRVPMKEVWIEGREMLKMGFYLSLGGLLTVISSYLLRIYITNIGGLAQVGLFFAGFAIINNYVGMIFNAMGTDYYPRLASIASDNKNARTLMNQQGEIALLILGPILTLFIAFAIPVIQLFFSAKFVEVNEMVKWAALGVFFKAASWTMGFLFLAKGDSSIFLKKEIIIHIITLALNILGYYIYGLTGLGISFLAIYIINFIIIYVIVHRKYGFVYFKEFRKIFIILFGIALITFILSQLLLTVPFYIIGAILFVLSGIYSYKELDKRIEIQKFLEKFKKK